MKNIDRLLTEQQSWIERELLEHLQQLIRLDSRTALARETQVARYLAAQLTAAGIRHELVEPIPGKGSVVAFLDGDDSEEPLPALLLLAHTDTADWQEREWWHPPLGGEYRGGFVWGRGAIDCKGLAAIWLVLLLLAAKLKLHVQRPIVFAAVADEEAGGKHGTRYLLEHTQLLQSVGHVLGEGGGFPAAFGGSWYLTCQTGERVEATGGTRCFHSASTGEFCRRVFAEQKSVYRWLAAVPFFWSMLLSRLQALAPTRLDLAGLFQAGRLSETQWRLPLFSLICDQVKRLPTFIDVLPYVTPGYSDNRFFRDRGIPTYGFFPLQDTKAIMTTHRANERVSLMELSTAFYILFQVVGRFCQMR